MSESVGIPEDTLTRDFGDKVRAMKTWFGRRSVPGLTCSSFILASLFGGTVLWLLEKSNPSVQMTWMDGWFTSVSALCVTGLTSVDFSRFTLAGQVVTAILILLGGWGIIFFTALLFTAVGAGQSKADAVSAIMAKAADSLGVKKRAELLRLVREIATVTLMVQVGTFAIMASYLLTAAPDSIREAAGGSIGRVIWFACFHAISSFNNAGFSTRGDNLTPFVTDYLISGVIGMNIILGGLYPLIIVVLRKFSNGKEQKPDLSGLPSPLQSKISIWGTLALIGVGVFLGLEKSLTNHSVLDRAFIGLFHGVSARTAGFNTVDLGQWQAWSLFLLTFMMYVGAAPGGTAGGIKITTFTVLVRYFANWYRATRLPVTIYGKPLHRLTVSYALRLGIASVLSIILCVFLLFIVESFNPRMDVPRYEMRVIFEAVSAYGTVGLSMGHPAVTNTSFCGGMLWPSKVILIALMLVGRVNLLMFMSWIAPLPDEERDAAEAAEFKRAGHKPDTFEQLGIG